VQIENLVAEKLLGKVNQYIFDQGKISSMFKINLANFRRLIEGVDP